MMMLRRLLKSGSNKRDKDKSKNNKNGRLNSTKPDHLQSRSDSASFSASDSGVAGGRPFQALDVDYIDNSHPNEDNSPEREWRTEQETSISAKQLHTQFVTKHADEDLLFRSEFEKIPEYIASVGVKCDCARRPENGSKNRYKNVVTSDRSRVKLNIQNDDPFSDYINATYIDGYDCKKKFIAAQGPKDNTLDDFWRMVWEQRCFVVVMITQLHEMGRRYYRATSTIPFGTQKKCELYWPNEGESCTYGSIKVTNKSKISHGTFVRRMLQIQHLETEETRDISQFQFLVWPDHGVPKSTSDIFRFRDRTLEAQPKDAGPILVHCSAGVGRTGTYIGLDVLLQQLHGRGKIDPLTLVVNFRLRRSEMVQSLEQYVLLHKLLDEWRTLGRTEFTIDNFAEKYDTLVSTGGIETEFKRVVNCLPLNTRLGRGTFEQNRIKNRDEHIVPYEHGQITIGMWPTEQIPVYYNASPLLTYEQGTPLIAAQGPMKNTCEDFWRAVLDNNVAIIVMLNPLDQAQPDVDYQYWPLVKDEIINLDENVTVTALSDPAPHERCDDVTITRLSVQSTRHDHTSVRDLVHIHYTCWDDADEISNPQQLLFLRQLMLDEMKLLADERPEPKTLIHCTNGCGRTGVFCSLINSLAYLNNEKFVDVSRSVKDLRDSRPHMVQTLKQYRLCYELVLRHILKLKSPSPPNGCKSTEMSEEEDNLKPTHEPIDLMKDLEHFGKLRCSIQLSKDERASEAVDDETYGKEQALNDQQDSAEECSTEDGKLIEEDQNTNLNGEEGQETVSEEHVSPKEQDTDANVEEDTAPKEQEIDSNVQDTAKKVQDSDSIEDDSAQKEQDSDSIEDEQDAASIEDDNAQKEQDYDSIEESNAQKEQDSDSIEDDNVQKEQDSDSIGESNAQKEQDAASIEDDNAQKEQDSDSIEESNAQKEQETVSNEEDNIQKQHETELIEEDNARKQKDSDSVEETNAQKEQNIDTNDEGTATTEQDSDSSEVNTAPKQQNIDSAEENMEATEQQQDTAESEKETNPNANKVQESGHGEADVQQQKCDPKEEEDQ